MSKFAFVQGDDWEAIYRDGKLVAEGHSLHPRQIFEALEIQVNEVYGFDFEPWGRAPEDFEELDRHPALQKVMDYYNKRADTDYGVGTDDLY